MFDICFPKQRISSIVIHLYGKTLSLIIDNHTNFDAQHLARIHFAKKKKKTHFSPIIESYQSFFFTNTYIIFVVKMSNSGFQLYLYFFSNVNDKINLFTTLLPQRSILNLFNSNILNKLKTYQLFRTSNKRLQNLIFVLINGSDTTQVQYHTCTCMTYYRPNDVLETVSTILSSELYSVIDYYIVNIKLNLIIYE